MQFRPGSKSNLFKNVLYLWGIKIFKNKFLQIYSNIILHCSRKFPFFRGNLRLHFYRSNRNQIFFNQTLKIIEFFLDMIFRHVDVIKLIYNGFPKA